MNLADLEELLAGLSENVFHYEAVGRSDQYIVWSEDSEGGNLNADDQKELQVIQGTIDLFTKMEGDPLFKKIQKTMNENEISWRLNSVQYEEETGYIHYDWVFEIEEVI